jgi:hypothetical protein
VGGQRLGFGRLSLGFEVNLVLDAAKPPPLGASENAHNLNVND